MKKYLLLLLMPVLFVSCGEVDTPENNALKKGHEDAAKVVITFVPGTLSNDSIGGNVYGDGFQPLRQDSVGSSTIIHAENDAHHLTTYGKVQLVAGQWYKMTIQFYNRSGASIDQQYVRNEEQRNMHQFYFQYKLKNGLGNAVAVEDKSDIGIDYRYGDKMNGAIIRPAIGFTGYIRVKPNAAHDFILNPILVHVVPPGIKTDRRGNSYPFYLPPLSHLGVTDVNFEFPVAVIPA